MHLDISKLHLVHSIINQQQQVESLTKFTPKKSGPAVCIDPVLGPDHGPPFQYGWAKLTLNQHSYSETLDTVHPVFIQDPTAEGEHSWRTVLPLAGENCS